MTDKEGGKHIVNGSFERYSYIRIGDILMRVDENVGFFRQEQVAPDLDPKTSLEVHRAALASIFSHARELLTVNGAEQWTVSFIRPSVPRLLVDCILVQQGDGVPPIVCEIADSE